MKYNKYVEQNRQSVMLKLMVERKYFIENSPEPLTKDSIFNYLITIYRNKNQDYVTNAFELIETGFVYTLDEIIAQFPKLKQTTVKRTNEINGIELFHEEHIEQTNELKKGYISFEEGIKTSDLAIISCLITKIRDDEIFRNDFLIDNSGKIRQCIYENGYKEQLEEKMTSKTKIKK